MDLFTCVFPLLCNVSVYQTNVISQRFDFVIVGGGTAGSVLAARLTENPKVKVLLLEAGGCPPFVSEIPLLNFLLSKPEYSWQDPIAPQKEAFLAYQNQQPNYIIGKMVGGSSSINSMVYVRGNKLDYDRWSTLGNTGWAYKDVLPYFLKSEGVTVPSMAADTKYHNTKGPLTVSYSPYHTTSLSAFLKSAQQNGYTIRDTNAKRQSGAMQTVFAMRNGSRCSTAKAYLLPAQHRPNLVIACNSRVKKILIDDTTKSATGVTFNRNGTDYYVSASREVILSAGAFYSPQLLLLSGIGSKSQLKKYRIPQKADLPGVGKNLHDHVACGALIWTVNCSSSCSLDTDTFLTSDLQEWLQTRNGPLTMSYAGEAMAFVNKPDDWPPAQLQFFATNNLGVGRSSGLLNNTLEKYLGSAANDFSFRIIASVMRPKSRGFVKLKSSNYKDAPLIDFRYLTDPYDVNILVEGIKTAVDFGNSKAFKPLGAKLIPNKFPGCEEYQQYCDDYWECVARHFTLIQFHPVGTCKMGVASDPMAVVDSELKVYKTKNLRVIDASIMPEIVSANTYAPVVMIAEKAADIIKKAYKI